MSSWKNQLTDAALRWRAGDLDTATAALISVMIKAEEQQPGVGMRLVASVIGQIGDEAERQAVIELVIEVSRRPEPDVAAQATDLLSYLDVPVPVQAGSADAAYDLDGIPGMDDLRYAVVLAELGQPGRASQVLRQLLDEGDPRLRTAAASKLAELADAAAAAPEPATPEPAAPGPDRKALVERLCGMLPREQFSGAAFAVVRLGAESGDAESLCLIGETLEAGGHIAEAREAYTLATESSNQAGAAKAMAAIANGYLQAALNSGDESDTETARGWYERGYHAGDHEVRMAACMNLGLIAKERRDLATATSWYQQVIDGGHENSGLAAAHLGELGYLLGDSVTASRFYLQSLSLTDDPELVAEAAFRLGEIRYHDGDHPAAIMLLHQAVSTGDPAFSDEAAALLKQVEAAG